MSTISIDDVKKLARLSSVLIDDEAAEALTHELREILGYVEQLNAVDTAGLEPTYQVTGLTNVMREDEIIDYGVDREALLRNAPHAHEGNIRVPRVLE